MGFLLQQEKQENTEYYIIKVNLTTFDFFLHLLRSGFEKWSGTRKQKLVWRYSNSHNFIFFEFFITPMSEISNFCYLQKHWVLSLWN